MAKGTCAVIEDGERLTNAADIQPTIVRFPVDLHARLRRAASSRQQSMNEVVNYAVEAWLEVQGEQVVPQVGELEDAHPGESRRLDPPSGTPGIAPKNAWRGHDELEEWRPVVGWEGYYEVSSRGRIGSLERIVHRTRGMDYVHPGRILKPGTCSAPMAGRRFAAFTSSSLRLSSGWHRLNLRASRYAISTAIA